MDCSPPGSSALGIFQERILEWIVASSSRGIFQTQGLNPRFWCLLHWQVDSLLLSHLGSPQWATSQDIRDKGQMRWPQAGHVPQKEVTVLLKASSFLSPFLSGPRTATPWVSRLRPTYTLGMNLSGDTVLLNRPHLTMPPGAFRP